MFNSMVFTARNASLGRRWVLALPLAALLTAGCAVKVPTQIQPVSNFDIQKYAGTWYEIARIDHRFERGLTKTSAHYSLNPDGTVKVLNRGWNAEAGRWKESEGKAQFLGDPKVAALKVSFFGPFYGGYNVVSLDDQYQTSMVIGDKLDYFWLLSRSKQIPQAQLTELLNRAQSLGVDLSQVMQVPQE